ncbi:MAG: HlyD family efflux transporter periplasmic adaptor subunit [Alphaproteobacteria bacterium]|nr:HlyD family efflux transporter periplasmic adaptor subunit [Alphaproteobacteria bacterium]MBL6939392.1 HlyD family efflux transporter periplasmic adaptor subunit [Alphaproteobacteria bacterium]MBL7097127.1 HlyD family efflux transporter periplasmic adaptor subunit [Alphaproteobacteria bacterium]
MSDATPVGRHRVDHRRRLLFILGGVVAVGVIAYALYYLLYAAHFESTDDAYVGGDIVAITSQENGTVLALHADNTEAVRRGQVLIELEPIKPKVAMDAAVADLARTVRSVRTDFSRVNQARAQLNAADIALSQAQSDYRRRASAGNAVSAEELVHARDAVNSASAAVAAAQSSLAQALSSVQGTSTATNPDVLAAIARLRNAAIVLQHMRLLAPVDGVVAQRTVQIGQQIAPGTPLMAVVPLQSVWVDANFKEGQLEAMRIGQPATITADIYGGGVTYHGRIVGLGAGSGSAFALLPPQNASGNWIKIVQRVPVRIALDPKELRDHPLRIGLSVNVSVDISDTSGSMTAAPASYHIQGISGSDGGAETEALIRRILSENGA